MQGQCSFIGVLIITTTTLCTVASGLRREYHYVHQYMTWDKAQQYCMDKYIDLAFISNQDDEKKLDFSRDKRHRNVWIGLYKDTDDPELWKWSGGWKSEHRFWNKAQTGNPGPKSCVSVGWYSKLMLYHTCEVKLPFICFDLNVVLVNKTKTWSQTVAHCRERYTDLLGLLSETDKLQVLQKIKKVETEAFWIGLRFLAGYWLWVNGDALAMQDVHELPSCPEKRCGTLRKAGERLVPEECERKLNFLCYWN